MIVTTTDSFEGHKILKYHGLVSGQSIISNTMGEAIQNFGSALGAAMQGRFPLSERVLSEAQGTALAMLRDRAQTMGANAVVGISMDIEPLGETGGTMLVSVLGTAVTVE